MNETQSAASAVSNRLKRVILTLGSILIVIGAPLMISLPCILTLAAMGGAGKDVTYFGVASLTLVVLTFGTGMTAFMHANRSLKGKPSKPLRFPPTFLLFGIFVFLVGLGVFIVASDAAVGILFPPILLAAAALPPLWAVAWMIPQAKPSAEGEAGAADQTSLSWRRGLLAFAGGATVSVFIAIVLEILLPVTLFALVFDLAENVAAQMESLFRALSSRDVAEALTNRGFIYLFMQIAVIAPLVEEFAKPLVVLPVVRHSSKQETFWLGALAGAGFAALENVIYAMSGFGIWAGILAVRAIGGALHPLGSGLVAQGWRGVMLGEKEAGKNWWKRFGIAVTVHAAWNGGSLLVITLGGARFFGDLPPEIDILGMSAAGSVLAFLFIIGLAALWIGRACSHDKSFLPAEGGEAEAGLVPSERAIALWAVACLIAIVPAGIAGLKLWLR
ncbi:MAG: PrsW family intramembrane metalloprotease [Chloroflexi bacterium]|nr:PrsW family intramembrane metalloprotease [Chloroflexota bacterium]